MIKCGEQVGEVPLDSIMGLIAMDLGMGTRVTVRAIHARGDTAAEQQAADRMAELLATKFDFRRD